MPQRQREYLRNHMNEGVTLNFDLWSPEYNQVISRS